MILIWIILVHCFKCIVQNIQFAHQYKMEEVDMFERVGQMVDVLKQQKLSPFLREFKRSLFDQIKQQLHEQQSKVKKFLENRQQTEVQDKNFKYAIYESQTQKIGYLLKCYLRTRLKKIQTYVFYLIKNPTIANKLLSPSQEIFLKKFADLQFKHLSQHALSFFPKKFQSFDGLFTQSVDEKPLVNSNQSAIKILDPNSKAFCAVIILRNPDQLRYGIDIKVQNINENDRQIISQNDIILGPFDQVRKLIEAGLAEFI